MKSKKIYFFNNLILRKRFSKFKIPYFEHCERKFYTLTNCESKRNSYFKIKTNNKIEDYSNQPKTVNNTIKMQPLTPKKYNNTLGFQATKEFFDNAFKLSKVNQEKNIPKEKEMRENLNRTNGKVNLYLYNKLSEVI